MNKIKPIVFLITITFEKLIPNNKKHKQNSNKIYSIFKISNLKNLNKNKSKTIMQEIGTVPK